MSLVSIIRGRRGASGYGYASTAEEVTEGLDLRGQHILVTGVNSGLGFETARVLGKHGARVLGAARSRDKAAEACRTFSADAVPLACELSEPDSVRGCVAEVQKLGVPLDAIVCNAGIMALPERTLHRGFELQFLTNHIGHFSLVTGLLSALGPQGRVVMLSSGAHNGAPRAGILFDDLTFERGYSPWEAYGHSKLANLLFARALARRFAGTGRTANALHPGVIATNLTRHMGLAARVGMPIMGVLAFKNVLQGAATQTYLAAHPAVTGISGEYFSDCNVAKSSKHGRDMNMAERLWTVSERIVASL